MPLSKSYLKLPLLLHYELIQLLPPGANGMQVIFLYDISLVQALDDSLQRGGS